MNQSDKEDLYDIIDKDDTLNDQEKRAAYFAEITLIEEKEYAEDNGDDINRDCYPY